MVVLHHSPALYSLLQVAWKHPHPSISQSPFCFLDLCTGENRASLSAGTRFHEDVSSAWGVFWRDKIILRGAFSLVLTSSFPHLVLLSTGFGVNSRQTSSLIRTVMLLCSPQTKHSGDGCGFLWRVTWIWFIINFQFVFPDHWPLFLVTREASVFRNVKGWHIFPPLLLVIPHKM